MNRTILALFAATALATALPAVALAQPGGDRYDNGGRSWQGINERQASLDARIDAGVRDRSLTPVEAARLRAEFQDIARMEAQYRASPPGLTRDERADLDRRFDDLDRRIHVNRNDNDRGRDGGRDGSWQGINERQASLDARIDAGVRDRSLTPAEAARLRAEFQDIARMEAQYRASPPGLTRDERADLDRRFDDLDRRIHVNRNDNDGGRDGNRDGGWQGINQRQANLDARIEAGVRDRSLTPVEAARLRAEFQDIARMEAQYRASPPGLTRDERADLDRRFDDLDRRIHANRTDDDRRWTNLDQRQAQFEQRLNRAVAERRISSRQAQRIRDEFRMIARLERQYRRSPPGITPPERSDLNTRYNRMEADYRAAVRGGNPLDELFYTLFGR